MSSPDELIVGRFLIDMIKLVDEADVELDLYTAISIQACFFFVWPSLLLLALQYSDNLLHITQSMCPVLKAIIHFSRHSVLLGLINGTILG